jgi:hypothetical protein
MSLDEIVLHGYPMSVAANSNQNRNRNQVPEETMHIASGNLIEGWIAFY